MAVLSDLMWARIEPELPPLQGKRGRPFTAHRSVIFRRSSDRGRRVWKRHYRFSLDGTWDRVLLAMQVEADAKGEIDWRGSVDSTAARVHQHGATAARLELKPTSHTGGSFELQGSAR
jgi:transposase